MTRAITNGTSVRLSPCWKMDAAEHAGLGKTCRSRQAEALLRTTAKWDGSAGWLGRLDVGGRIGRGVRRGHVQAELHPHPICGRGLLPCGSFATSRRFGGLPRMDGAPLTGDGLLRLVQNGRTSACASSGFAIPLSTLFPLGGLIPAALHALLVLRPRRYKGAQRLGSWQRTVSLRGSPSEPAAMAARWR